MWVTRRTIRVTGDASSLYWPGGGADPEVCPNYHEQVTLELDTIWETGLDG